MRQKTKYFLLLFFASFQVILAQENDSLPIIEMTADRTIIYPQRMDLRGNESLLDILQTYPDLLINAFDNWLEGYSIRINNGPYGGDMRVILKETRAADIEMIQISDNPGVAKGTTGINGIVDIRLRPQQQGAHCSVGAQISTDLNITPSAAFSFGSAHTDIIANASYTYRHLHPFSTHEQYANYHMLNNLSDKDQLLTYFTQSFVREHHVADTTRIDNRDFHAQLRHFHNFTPTSQLLTAVVYKHTFSPLTRFSLNDGHTVSFMSSDWQGTLAACQEYNASFHNGLNLMAGWEVDYGMGVQREEDAESQLAKRTLNYNVMNADVYFELDYTYKHWRFTYGDRVMFYRYRVDVPVGDRSHNDWRNMLHMSVIYTPHHEHQVQLAYVRKFYNPSYMGLFREARGMTDEEWLLAENNITETQLDEVKLAYGFSRKRICARMNAYYYNVARRYTFFKLDASAFYKYRFFSLSGGVDWYFSEETNYVTLRVEPVFELPYQMQIKTNVLYYSPKAPSRNYNYNKPVYATLQFSKQFGSYLNLFAEWHDIFNGQYGIGLFGVLLRL